MRTLIALFALLYAATLTLAAIPPQTNYQGTLMRRNGTPLDTTVSMTFKLYAAMVGGSAVWTESQAPQQRGACTVESRVLRILRCV